MSEKPPGPDAVQGLAMILMSTVNKVRDKNAGLPWHVIFGAMEMARGELYAQWLDERAMVIDAEESKKPKIVIAGTVPDIKNL